MLKRFTVLLLLLAPPRIHAQQDSLQPPAHDRGGGRGDGSGGGRGDGSGGGRSDGSRRGQVVEEHPVILPIASTPKAGTIPRPSEPPKRQRFGGLFDNSWENFDERLPESGINAPATLVRSYTLATTSVERSRIATEIIDTLLDRGTSAAQFAWGDSLRIIGLGLQDSVLLAKAHFARGTALIREGRNGRAFDDLRRALTLIDEERHPELTAMIQSRIGDGIMRMGGSTGAMQRYRETMRLSSRHAIPPPLLAHVLTTMAFIHVDMEDLDSAAFYYEQAVQVAQRGALATMQARAAIGLGDVAGLRGELMEAVEHYRDAIDLLHLLPPDHALLDARAALGEVLLARGRIIEARAELLSAVQLADSLPAFFQGAKARIHLADAMGTDHKAAFAILDEAEAIALAHDLGAVRKEVLLSRSERYARMGRLGEAHDLAMKAVALSDSLNLAFWEAGTRRQLQRSQVGLKDREIDDLEQQGSEQRIIAGLQQERIRQQRILMSASAIVAVIVLALAFIAWRGYRRQKRTSHDLERMHAEVLVQKQRAEKSERAKDRFLANVSHEIRTPLNAIMGFSDILLDEQHDGRSARFLRSIRDAGDNLMTVINDVLDSSRMEAGRLTLIDEVFDLHQCVHHCVELLQQRAATQHDRLLLGIMPGTPQWVRGDRARLAQILLNLLGNAIKFTNDGEVRFEVSRIDDGMRFRITDTGIGIAKEKLATVFDRFTQVDVNDQRRFGGTGLGLSIVRDLVELHKGGVHMESEPGHGTTFIVDLPLVPAEAPAPPPASTAPRSNGALSGRIILVAEDNEMNALVVNEILKRRFPGSEIVHVPNGHEAVERVTKDGDRIGLVLMDVQMPQLDGMSATRLLRKEGSKVPIIALTASVLPSELTQCIEAGMDACVPKPFKVQELLGAIIRLTGDGGIPAPNGSEASDPYEALFKELVPSRLHALQEAHVRGDRQEVQRLFHMLRPQLVHRDADRFAPLCDEVLTLAPDAPAERWDASVEGSIRAIGSMLA